MNNTNDWWYISESQSLADRAAKLVQITYTNEQTPITDIREAIDAGWFFTKPNDVIKGDAEGQVTVLVRLMYTLCGR